MRRPFARLALRPFPRFAAVLAAALALVAPVASAVSPDVVISQVYGGGGNTGATYTNDFIELYNRGTTAVSLAGWSVQYGAATGSTYAVTNLSGTIQPGHYYLVQEANGAGGTTALPAPDATGTIAMSGTAGKVALVTNTTALTCGTACAGAAGVRDFVGFGTTANNFEGSGPTPAPSNTTAVLRAGGGAIDTDSNATDFSSGPPNPRNSAISNQINGSCGANNGQTLAALAPTLLCNAGSASAVSGSGHPWSWSCNGSSGGTNASCSATIQSYSLGFTTDGNGSVTGSATQSVDFGAASTAVTAVASSGFAFQNWTGPAGFSSTANPLVVSGVAAAGSYVAHFTSAVVNGACGTDNGQTLAATAPTNLCSAGTAGAVAGSGHPWTWSCTGGNGGSTASCSANIRSYTLSFTTAGNGTLSDSTTQTVDHGAASTPVTATPGTDSSFVNWTGGAGFTTTTTNPLTIASVTSSQAIVAHFKGGFTIFHSNDVHARLTPHKWIINQHGNNVPVFEDVGGAAALAGKLLALAGGQPNSLVLDGGDISEGNPVGDMNSGSTGGYGNGGMTAFYELLHGKLKLVAGRGGRGFDALVVGNHDVRDATYITNMEHMRDVAGVPVISVNVRDIATHTPHFAPTTTVTVNGTKIGIIGFTTPSAQVGASLAATMEVVDCPWTGGTTGCNMSTYVNDLRVNQGCDIVILLTHDGHSDLVDPAAPILADTASPKVPEIAVTGHWHTWAETVWQPQQLNYKTIFTESSSYMKYLGELKVSATGAYVSSTQHVLRNADITPDPDVQAFVTQKISEYNALNPGHPVSEVVGYTADNLLLDNQMKWWSADEYPWNGNNTAGQWITDAMKWKCDQIWSAAGGCDLAVEAGGGVRADIPAGPVTYLQVYETFPWADDTYYRINMTGQDILNFLKATNMGGGFSSALDVTAFDGIATGADVKMNGVPIGLTTVYKVAINNYMYAHPPGGYIWPDTAPLTSPELVRDSLSEFMRQVHGTQATAYSVGGSRYHFNGEYAGGYRAVITMMDDVESDPKFEKAFIRLLSATPETLARRGSRQVPADLVNADGSINQANRLAEQELYRSFLGFKRGTLHAGDIIETYGKASFFDGNPEFVDQEGVYGDGVEFKLVGTNTSLAAPTSVASIRVFWNDPFYKNHFIRFLARKAGTDTVTDQYGQTIKIWDATGYNTTAAALPGNVGDVLEITGVPTMENFTLRFRRASVVVSTSVLPPALTVGSVVAALPGSVSAPVTLNASASSTSTYTLAPVADNQVASASARANTVFGTGSNVFVQSSATGSFGNERVWVRFDLSALPAGLNISGATLQLWNWKSTGAALPAEVRGGTSDTWTETTLTWNNQPTFGSPLDVQTLGANAVDLYYSWNVGSFVQQKFSGNKLVSLVVKPVTENSIDATSPSYSFDTKEFGSGVPQLQVQATGSVASVRLFYRYSTDNASWGQWTAYGSPITTPPFTSNFSFPNGTGYYEFYSLATDSLGNTEAAPATAQASTRFVAAAAQTITFAAPANVSVGTAVLLSATASSGLPVSFSSQTPAVCTVSGNLASTLAVGTCTIAADQAGNASFAPAPTVVRSFSVTTIAQSINFPAIANATLGSAPFGISATATSGLAVSFASQTPAVCTVAGSTVTLVAVGSCTVVANQAGNATYAPAAAATQSFTVSAATNGGGNTNGDVPLPAWALWLLGSGLLGATLRRRRTLH